MPPQNNSSQGPSSAPSSAERTGMGEFFEEKGDAVTTKLEENSHLELSDSLKLKGYKRWSAVSDADLLDEKMYGFGYVQLPDGTLQDVLDKDWNPDLARHAGTVIYDSPRNYWNRQVGSAKQDYPDWQARIDTEAAERLQKSIDKAQEKFLEKDMQQLMHQVQQNQRFLFGQMHVPEDIVGDHIKYMGLQLEQGKPKTIGDHWKEILDGYLEANYPKGKEKERERFRQKADATFRLALAVEIGKDHIIEQKKEDVDGDIERRKYFSWIDTVAASVARNIDNPDDKEAILNSAKETKEMLTSQAEQIHKAVDYVAIRDQYFTNAVFEFLQANYPEHQKRDAWKIVVNRFKNGYTDENGKEQKGYGDINGIDDYAWNLYEQYIHPPTDPDQLISKMGFTLADFTPEQRRAALLDTYASQQEAILQQSSDAELRVRGFLDVQKLRQIEQKYNVLTKTPQGQRDNEHYKLYQSVQGELATYEALFNDQNVSETEIETKFQELSEKQGNVLGSLAPLLAMQGMKPKAPEIVQFLRDIQHQNDGLLHRILDDPQNFIKTIQEKPIITRDQGGMVMNNVASFYLNWNLATLGVGIIDKIGARHREHPFSRHWNRKLGVFPVPKVDFRPSGWKKYAANNLVAAYMVGHYAGIDPVYHTARLYGKGAMREFDLIGNAIGAVAGITHFDWNAGAGESYGLSGTLLHGGRFASDALYLPLWQHLGEQYPGVPGLAAFGAGSKSLDNRMKDVFKSGRIDDPEIAASFLKDPKLAELLRTAGAAEKLHKRIQGLRQEIEMLQTQHAELQAKARAETDIAQQQIWDQKVADMDLKIQSRKSELTQSEINLKTHQQELFDNPENLERMKMYRSWSKMFNLGLRDAPTKENGTMEVDKHGQDKIWSVVNRTFDEAYFNRHKTFLTDATGKYDVLLREGGERSGARTEFSKKYAEFLLGNPTTSEFIAFGKQFPGNPFVDHEFKPMVHRHKLMHHVNAHNLSERNYLSQKVMRMIGRGPGAWILAVMAMGWMVKFSIEHPKLGLAMFPTTASTSLLLKKLFSASEDEEESDDKSKAESPEVTPMLSLAPDKDKDWKEDKEKLIRAVFESPKIHKDHGRNHLGKPKATVDLIDYLDKLQDRHLMIVPQSVLMAKLLEAERQTGMMEDLKPRSFSTKQDSSSKRGRLQDTIIELGKPESSAKDVYEALRRDLEAASKVKDKDDGYKTNPLHAVGIMDAYDAKAEASDAPFLAIHEQMGELVSLAANENVKGAVIEVEYSAGDSETFEMDFKSESTKEAVKETFKKKQYISREPFKRWWKEKNTKKYKPGNKFKAKRASEKDGEAKDFQLYYDDRSGHEGFNLQFGSDRNSARKVKSIQVRRKLDDGGDS